MITCSQCGKEVKPNSEEAEAAARAEALENWGRTFDTPGMMIVCDDCYNEIMRRRKAAWN